MSNARIIGDTLLAANLISLDTIKFTEDDYITMADFVLFARCDALLLAEYDYMEEKRVVPGEQQA